MLPNQPVIAPIQAEAEREITATASRIGSVLYLLFFSVWLVCMCVALAEKDKDASIGFFVFLVLMWPWVLPALRRVRGLSYRLTADALQEVTASGVRELKYADILGVQTRLLAKSELNKARITVVGVKERIEIVRSLSMNSYTVFVQLVQRLYKVHCCRHLAAVDGPPFPQYSLPPELLAIVDEQRTKGTVDRMLAFRGPVQKYGGGRQLLRATFLFFIRLGAGMLLLSATGLANSGFSGAGFLLPFGFFYILTWLPPFSTPKPEWLLIHTDGIAMLGTALTGELNWDEVAKLTDMNTMNFRVGHESGAPANAYFFYLETHDGARVPVGDIYDAPITLIEQLCGEYRRKALAARSSTLPAV